MFLFLTEFFLFPREVLSKTRSARAPPPPSPFSGRPLRFWALSGWSLPILSWTDMVLSDFGALWSGLWGVLMVPGVVLGALPSVGGKPSSSAIRSLRKSMKSLLGGLGSLLWALGSFLTALGWLLGPLGRSWVSLERSWLALGCSRRAAGASRAA